MTREEFRARLMRQGNGAVGNVVDACLMFQLEYGIDVLDMQSSKFDLLVEAHNERMKRQEEIYKGSGGVKKRFGYG